jgi:hypothetical protein
MRSPVAAIDRTQIRAFRLYRKSMAIRPEQTINH